ncbi:MAG TPA: GNAT family N-acetyltransferase, partial [Halalkalibaculum sp.]|nr:GNAT family N-acetyltransferase [Halalkalibaculum sp.]
MKLSKITATRLKLRPLTYDDTEDIFEIFSDAEVTRYWGHDTLQKREEARDFIEKTISGAKDGSLLEWG